METLEGFELTLDQQSSCDSNLFGFTHVYVIIYWICLNK